MWARPHLHCTCAKRGLVFHAAEGRHVKAAPGSSRAAAPAAGAEPRGPGADAAAALPAERAASPTSRTGRGRGGGMHCAGAARPGPAPSAAPPPLRESRRGRCGARGAGARGRRGELPPPAPRGRGPPPRRQPAFKGDGGGARRLLWQRQRRSDSLFWRPPPCTATWGSSWRPALPPARCWRARSRAGRRRRPEGQRWRRHGAGAGVRGGTTARRRRRTTTLTSSRWWRGSSIAAPASWRTSWWRGCAPARAWRSGATAFAASSASSSPATMCLASPSPSSATTASGRWSRATERSTASTARPAREVRSAASPGPRRAGPPCPRPSPRVLPRLLPARPARQAAASLCHPWYPIPEGRQEQGGSSTAIQRSAGPAGDPRASPGIGCRGCRSGLRRTHRRSGGEENPLLILTRCDSHLDSICRETWEHHARTACSGRELEEPLSLYTQPTVFSKT